MVDSVSVFPPGARFLDASGSILAGGSIEFYDAQTGPEGAKTVYSDSGLTTALGPVVYLDTGGAPVSEQGGSTKVQVYVGTDPYKVIVKDSAGVVQETKDNIAGAFDSASILETLTLIPETEVQTLTGDTTLTSADAGELKNCNSTGGAFSVTLPDATALSNGARFGVRMAGTANSVKIKTTGSQTITRGGAASTAVALTRFGESVWLVNDGGNWVQDTYVPPLLNTVGVIVIADRTATPPAANSGARYIVTSGPTGAWSSYTEHDIVEDDGQGGFYRITPATDCGWIAYVQDEDAYYWFIGTAWVQQTASSTVAGTIKVSTQAIMETGTATDAAVLVGHQHFHPAHPKAWGIVTVSGGTPTLVSSYNVSGITDTAAGRLTVTLDVDMSSTNYAVVPGGETSSGTSAYMFSVSQGSRAVGSFELCCKQDDNGSPIDPAAWFFAVFGDHA